jgi:pimeloyl-ACP methyl ester carboxylesterase
MAEAPATGARIANGSRVNGESSTWRTASTPRGIWKSAVMSIRDAWQFAAEAREAYTTLCALVFHNVFTAGASYFGVADLEALAHDTHKFEAKYEDGMVGPYPEMAALYKERSPVHFADRLSCPVILLQGLEDKVVPPSQAEVMIAALRAKRLPFAYVAFPTEGHGFREAANIKRSIEAELYFYSRIFGFTPADPIEPVDIENL